MIAENNNGEIVTLHPGEAVCGYSFRWVKIEPADLKYARGSELAQKAFEEWLRHILFVRLDPR